VFTLRGTWMRGGTSKCWLFNAVDVDPLIEDAGRPSFSIFDPTFLDSQSGSSSTKQSSGGIFGGGNEVQITHVARGLLSDQPRCARAL
jgi:hypothetical protein